MNVLVVGATGFVGGHVARHFVRAGHRVLGSARTQEAADRLASDGIEAVLADFEGRRAPLLTAVAQADAVVFAAQLEPDAEVDAVGALLDAMAGSRTTFVFTSGSGVLLQRTAGAWSPDSFDEDDDFVVEPLATARRRTEQLVQDASIDGLRSMVVRPGMIWGPDDHGHVSMIYRSVATTGAACYVGDGLNVYSHVHVDDVARLFEAAVSRGRAGALYHAVAGETPTRWIAERVAADLGVDTRSLDPAEAVEVFGEFGALIAGATSRIRAPRSREELGWAPRHADMLSTIGEPRLRRLAQTRSA